MAKAVATLVPLQFFTFVLSPVQSGAAVPITNKMPMVLDMAI